MPLAAQQFSAGELLPGDDTPAASAGNQRRPAIAAGGNGLSLAVWEDDRSSLVDTVFGGQAVGSSVPGNFDIYGVLLDANGLPLSTEPIVVNGDTWDQLTPKVAWNGSEYLVVFSSVKPTQFYYSRGIYGVRVSATGAVLDRVPIRIDDDDGADEQFPTVSSLGGSWLCAWTDVGTSSNTIVNSAFVAANGIVSAPRPLVAGTVSSVPTEPRLTAANGRHLLAWSLGFGSGIRAALFDGLGNAQGGVLTLAASSGRRPAVASDGTGFYVAWQGSGLLLGTPVSSAGVVAVPGGTSLVPGQALGDSDVAVGHDGSEWLVASNISPDLIAAKVAANGTVASTPILVTNSPRSLYDVAVGNGNGAVRVLWTDRRTTRNSFGGDHDDVFGALVTGTTPSASAAVSTSRPAQVGAKFAGDPATGILCVWKSLDGGTTRFVAAAVDAEGVPVGLPFVVHQGDRSIDGVDVAWDGHEFLVTWHELRSTTSNGVPPMVYCRRCRLDGTLLDAAPLPAMEGTYAAVAAVDRTFLIVARYHHVVLQSNAQMRCRRLDGLNGAFWEATPTVVATGVAGLVDVVGMLDRWFVVWGNITAAFVGNTGIPQTPFYAASTGASGTAFRLATNQDRTEAVLAHHYNALSGVHQTDLRIRRFGLTGTSPDAMAGPLVTTARQAQLRPAIAALDGEYLVAWADHRDVLDYEPGLGDVFAARLDPTGALLDPSGLPVHDTPVAEGGVDLIRSGRGRALHVASVLHEGTHRLRLGTYANASAAPWTTLGQGLAGTSGVPTLHGYGTLQPGAGFDLQLASARPNALALLVLGTGAQNAPLLGGTLVPVPAATSLATVLFDGSAGFANAWPAGFSGVHLYAQYWLLDAQAAQGVAASPGLRGIAP